MFVKYLILYMIRKRLGLSLYEPFRFKGQSHEEDCYFFGKYALMKNEYHALYNRKTRKPILEIRETQNSRVSLEYLLSEAIKKDIERVKIHNFNKLEVKD